MTRGTLEPAEASSSCDRRGDAVREFEAAWLSARSPEMRPRLLDYLEHLGEADRIEVFSSLLAVELRCRLMQQELPVAEEYFALFPGGTDIIRSVFESLASSKMASTSAQSKRQSDAHDLAKTVDYRAADRHLPKNDSQVLTVKGSGAMEDPCLGESRGWPSVPGYEILEELGRGGMGVVYKARHLRLQRLVALKMLLPGEKGSSARQSRFLSEARAVAQFQHVNLVQIFEIGETEDRTFISLELVEGKTLARILDGTPLPPAEAAALIETLANALEYAHRKGIVHRDVKPSNILYTRYSATWWTTVGGGRCPFFLPSGL